MRIDLPRHALAAMIVAFLLGCSDDPTMPTGAQPGSDPSPAPFQLRPDQLRMIQDFGFTPQQLGAFGLPSQPDQLSTRVSRGVLRGTSGLSFAMAGNTSPTRFRLPEDPTAGVASGALALEINASGQAVGYAFFGNRPRALRWEAGDAPSLLTQPAGAAHSTAEAINDDGRATGYATLPISVSGANTFTQKAVIWESDGVPTVLPDPVGVGDASTAYLQTFGIDLSANGVVVGYASARTADHRPIETVPVVWSAGSATALPHPSNCDNTTFGHGVDDAGVVFAYHCGRAYRYIRGAWNILPLVYGSVGQSDVSDVRADGSAVGFVNEPGNSYPIVWAPDGTPKALHPLPAGVAAGYGYGFDSNGRVVGEVHLSAGGARPFIWHGGDYTLLEPAVTGQYATARGINAAGVVVGWGNLEPNNGNTRQALSWVPLFSSDADNDTIADTDDNCPSTPNSDQLDTDLDAQGDPCDSDDDNDARMDSEDNCPVVANTGQANVDGDALGDACDPDNDNDGVPDSAPDNCPLVANAAQDDTDGDGVGDACAGATAVGSGVTVRPVDAETGQAEVTITFASVVKGGETSVSVSAQGAPPPAGFRLGAPPVYYELLTTATYTGPITVCIDYSDVSFSNSNNLRLLHGSAGGNWTNVTGSHDLGTTTICGTVTSLSPFLVVESQYAFGGFLQPVENPGAAGITNKAKAGSAIPVKFSLGGSWGLDIFAPQSNGSAGAPTSGAYGCTGALEDAIEQTVAAGSSGLQHDITTGVYTYVWKTDLAWASGTKTCRRLLLVFRDGTTAQALFRFVK